MVRQDRTWANSTCRSSRRSPAGLNPNLTAEPVRRDTTSFTPADSASARAGLVDIVVPTVVPTAVTDTQVPAAAPEIATAPPAAPGPYAAAQSALDSLVTGAAVPGIAVPTGPEAPTTTPATETPKVEQFTGDKIDSQWTAFSPENGTKGIPRAEMPQVAEKDRIALVSYLGTKGIASEQVEVQADSLKPTQAEFSQGKVDALKTAPGDRSILISSDGHVLDGHHQWKAALDAAGSEQERRVLATALASSRDAGRAQELLDRMLQGDLPTNTASLMPRLLSQHSPDGDLAYRHVVEHWEGWSRIAGQVGRRWLLPGAAEHANDPARAKSLIDDQARLVGPDGAQLAARAAARIGQLADLKARASGFGP